MVNEVNLGRKRRPAQSDPGVVAQRVLTTTTGGSHNDFFHPKVLRKVVGLPQV